MLLVTASFHGSYVGRGAEIGEMWGFTGSFALPSGRFYYWEEANFMLRQAAGETCTVSFVLSSLGMCLLVYTCIV